MGLIFNFLFVLFSITSAHAQIAGASFNSATLSINPAASVLRPFGHFSIAHNWEGISSKVKQERSDFEQFPWEEEVQIHRSELVLTYVSKIFFPEIFVSYDTVQKKTTLDDSTGGSSQSQSDNAAFVNNMANLGIALSKRVGVGVKYYSPVFDMKYDNSYSYSDGNSYRNIVDYNGQYTGIGFGLIAKINQKFNLGLYTIKSTQKIKGDVTYIDINGDSESETEGSVSFDTKGIGFSYVNGNRRNGSRAELAYSRSDLLDKGSANAKYGEQIFIALEAATKGISFGASIRLLKNGFLDNLRLVESFIDPPPREDAFAPKYDYFLSFISSKGHSIGLSGSYWESDGEKSFLGSYQNAKTKSMSAALNYTYIF